jgi:Family of unknown function (DUF5994)
MTSTTCHSDLLSASKTPRVLFEPVGFHHTLLDGSWWPDSADLDAELCVLVSVLDHVRGPVTRLLLSAAGWTSRPHQVVAGGRTVSVGYLAGQPSSLLTVLCADGGSFLLRVAPPGPAPSAPDQLVADWDVDGWESEGGGLGSRGKQAGR